MQTEVATFSYSRKNSTKSVDSKGPQVLHCPGRTQGDGMENVVAEKVEKTNKTRLGETLIYHPTNLKQSNLTQPVTPTGTIVNLVPNSMTQIKTERHILHSLKMKEPKFVPYEPYKAAVNPIIPSDKKTKRILRKKIDINSMLSSMTLLPSEGEKNESERTNNVEPNKWDIEKKEYEAEIQKLKEENSQLENQLKFQAQVNGELKNLLVAAVGEDLETKVHLLTEDKVQLARALLNSAQHLNTHQEQTEWLAGQCEVWRSKFLASSLMVEELARWKAALSQRTTDLQETVKRLLEEHGRVRENSLKTYRTLCILRENFDPIGASIARKHDLKSTNIIDLSEGCCQLAESLKVQLLSGMNNVNLRKEIDITGLEMKTPAEKNSEQLLMSPNLLISGRQDAACSAVMGAAVAVGGHTFFQLNSSNSPNMACCPYCSGEVKQV